MRAGSLYGTLALLCFNLVESPALAKVKDLRTQSTAADPEVGFCSRPSPDKFGFPGHVFVTFSTRLSNGNRDFRAVGHTIAAGTSPLGAALTYFGGKPIAGKQAEERYTDIKQSCLTLKLDRDSYDAALQAAQPTLTLFGIPANVAASVELYSLKDNDCISFAERVALAVQPKGLNVPARSATDTPASWIARLVAANP